MPQAHRLGDTCSGHGCFPPRPNTQGSKNVFVNDKAWHLQSQLWKIHCCGSDPEVCHSAKTSGGSETVFVNNIKVARFGDAVSCGSYCMTCSPDVFAGPDRSGPITPTP
jgi:uncharacterized Zn-binding protein involved in type VI secretion